VQVVDVAFEGLALNSEGQIVVVAFQLLSVEDWPDNLPLEAIGDFVLSALDGGLGGDLAVAEVVCLSVLNDFLQVDQSLPGDEDVVVFEEVGHVELARGLHSNVLQVASC